VKLKAVSALKTFLHIRIASVDDSDRSVWGPYGLEPLEHWDRGIKPSRGTELHFSVLR